MQPTPKPPAHPELVEGERAERGGVGFLYADDARRREKGVLGGKMHRSVVIPSMSPYTEHEKNGARGRSVA